MNAEVVFVDDAHQWQGVEGIHQLEVYILVVFLGDLYVKVHELCHLPSLVVPSEEDDFFGKLYFEGKQKKSDLQTHRPPIHIIPQKQEVLFRLRFKRRKETEYFQQIVELPMYVSNHDNRLIYVQDIGLIF